MDFGDLVGVGVAFVVVGVVLAIGLSVLGDVKFDLGADSCGARTDGYTTYNETNELCTNGTGFTTVPSDTYYNATQSAVNGTGELASKLPLLGLVIAAAIIIGVLLKSFANR